MNRLKGRIFTLSPQWSMIESRSSGLRSKVPGRMEEGGNLAMTSCVQLPVGYMGKLWAVEVLLRKQADCH